MARTVKVLRFVKLGVVADSLPKEVVRWLAVEVEFPAFIIC